MTIAINHITVTPVRLLQQEADGHPSYKGRVTDIFVFALVKRRGPFHTAVSFKDLPEQFSLAEQTAG